MALLRKYDGQENTVQFSHDGIAITPEIKTNDPAALLDTLGAALDAAYDTRKDRQDSDRTFLKHNVWLTAGLAMAGGLTLIVVGVLTDLKWHWQFRSRFIEEVGLLLSAITAGTLVHEFLLREQMFHNFKGELDRQFNEKVPPLDRIATETAKRTHDRFSRHPPNMNGLRLLTQERRNYPGYFAWTNVANRQNLFFAGRSVLHRIDKYVRREKTSTAEDVLLRRLREGSSITILFLDPRIEILQRLAKEEGERIESLLEDLANSIGICERLFSLIQRNYLQFEDGAKLIVRLYTQVPYFAYHRQDDFEVVGFYFSGSPGSASGAYEIVGNETKLKFKSHFQSVFTDAVDLTLLDFDVAHGRPRKDVLLFEQLQNYLREKLPPGVADEIMSP